MIHPCYRNELKYNISKVSRLILSRQLGYIMKRDPHAEGAGYKIRSLYFDTIDDRALKDNLLGAAHREKYRIRCYNSDYGFIRLEKKVRHFQKGYKVSAALSLSDTDKIIKGDTDFLKDSEDDLLREFYLKIRTEMLKPCLVVSYFREPFLYGPGNVRVTLDDHLKFSNDPLSFLCEDGHIFSENEDKCLLEVKYDEFLPSMIKTMLEAQDPMRTANSKYVKGRFLTGI